MSLVFLLLLAGIFTLVLGLLHFFLPLMLDFRSVVLDRPSDWKRARAFRLWPSRYVVTLSDRLGIVWVMNHAASYTLVGIGLVDVLAGRWLTTDPGCGPHPCTVDWRLVVGARGVPANLRPAGG